MQYLISLNQRYWAPLTIVLLMIITAGSLEPTHGPLPETLPWDKARHFLAYGAIALPIALARPRNWMLLIAGVVGRSVAIECAQPFVGRVCDIRDFLANASGVMMALLGAEILRHMAFSHWRRR